MSYGALFGRSTTEARHDNWTSYLDFIRKTSGELLEADKDLTHKRELLKQLSAPAVRTREPLASAEAFYRNCDKLRDDPRSLDKKTLTLTCIYKFARHEWAGIEAAWSAFPLRHFGGAGPRLRADGGDFLFSLEAAVKRSFCPPTRSPGTTPTAARS